MPIIAGRASAAYGSGFGAVTTVSYLGPYGAFDALATITVGATAVPSVTFANIPTGYKHLQIRGVSRCSRAIASTNTVIMGFNGDSTPANYHSGHTASGDGANPLSQSITTVGSMGGTWAGLSTGGSAPANIFSSWVTDILDYSHTNKYKTTRSFQGSEDNASNGYIALIGGLWLSTSAINSITVFEGTTTNFVQYSSFSLYGVK